MPLQNQSRDQLSDWLHAFHHAADSLTATTLHKFYSKDATLKFANNDPLIGLDSIIAFFSTAFPKLKTMKHEVVDFGTPPAPTNLLNINLKKALDTIKDKIYLTCTVTYVAKNDPKQERFTIPAVGIFLLLSASEQEKVPEGEGVIQKFEVYLDVQAVRARMGEVAVGKV